MTILISSFDGKDVDGTYDIKSDTKVAVINNGETSTF